jgi:thiamine biosynthesis protein ThiS
MDTRLRGYDDFFRRQHPLIYRKSNMNITLNGRSKELAASVTIEQLLQTLQLDPSQVAVEHNRKILPRAHFAQTALSDGDQLEIIHFVGGGKIRQEAIDAGP